MSLESRQSPLEYTPEIAAATADLYQRVKSVIPRGEWAVHAPYIQAIERLKKRAQRRHPGAQLPDARDLSRRCRSHRGLPGPGADGRRIDGRRHRALRSALHGGDGQAAEPREDRPIPDAKAGCSLADSITGADIRLLREKYPGVPVVTYVNTSAEVKAESDICCTSSNAVAGRRVAGCRPSALALPDEYLAKWVATQTDVEIITWKGHCEVHERFTPRSSAATARTLRRPGHHRAPGMSARSARRGGLRRDRRRP